MEKISYAGYRFPPEIIPQAIWLYLRFTLSLRDVEDLLAERGVALSYETVRRWVKSLRTDHRCRFAEASPEAAWDLASGRGLSENRRPNGLPLAGRRRRRRGPRRAGPIQAKQARSLEADAQTFEEICLRSRAVGHRRFAIIQRRSPCSWDRALPRAR